MERPNQDPGEIDLRSVNAARIYDYYLGGAHNFAVDRELAEAAAELMPGLPHLMQTNRAFLGRAVRFLVANGVSQFVDLGSGLPTAGNVYDVARRVDPEARVVHVDVDPAVVAHSRCMVSAPNAAMIEADLRDPEAVLDNSVSRGLLDLHRPIGLLMLFVLDFVPYDEDLPGLLARYRERMAPGSYLVVSHTTVDSGVDPYTKAQDLYRKYAIEVFPRSRREVSSLLAGFELAEPGVVCVPAWRPETVSVEDIDDHPERTVAYAAVGRRT